MGWSMLLLQYCKMKPVEWLSRWKYHISFLVFFLCFTLTSRLEKSSLSHWLLGWGNLVFHHPQTHSFRFLQLSLPLSFECVPYLSFCIHLLLLSRFNRVRPHRRQPTRHPAPGPWDSLGKNTGVGCHFLLQCVKMKLLSRVWLLATPWTAAYQAPPSMGFSRQEYWSGLPLPSPKCKARTI